MIGLLLWRAPMRHFARLDNQGRCHSLWQLAEPPDSGHWVEITHSDPRWLGQVIPPDALTPRPDARRQRQPWQAQPV